MSTNQQKATKIVGLVQVRNDENFIENCLRSLACYADEIVIVDDASSDDTVKILKSLQMELPIARIIELKDSSWQNRSERYNRQLLLDTGREIGGTHFILIDADEMFTAECLKQNWLRKKILEMIPGQMLAFRMVNVWGSTNYYRDDSGCSPYSGYWKSIKCVFCDDGKANYDDNRHWDTAGAIHVSRAIKKRTCQFGPKNINVKNINYCVIHFKNVNLQNSATKKIWYKCLELIRASSKQNFDKNSQSSKINNLYTAVQFGGVEDQERDIRLQKVPSSWYEGYLFFDKEKINAYNWSRHHEILQWIERYGLDFFAGLNLPDSQWFKNAPSK